MTDSQTLLRRIHRAPSPVDEPSLFYDPPYECRRDDEVAWRLMRTLAPQNALQYRTVVLTPDDCFRVDFLIERERGPYPHRVGLLLGAAEDEDAVLHDALIVGAGAVDVLYRLPSDDLERRLIDALYLMAQWDPALFRTGGQAWLRRRASEEACGTSVRAAEAEAAVDYPAGLVAVRPGEIPERPAPASRPVLRRWDRRHPAAWARAYGRALERYDRNRAWPRRA